VPSSSTGDRSKNIDGEAMGMTTGHREPVEFYQDDGYRIAADLYGDPDRARGGIIFCHGWGGTKDVVAPTLALEMVERLPCVALVFDYAGWGASEGPRGRIDPHYQSRDVRSAVSYVAQRFPQLSARIGLYGFSFGGSISTYVGSVDRRVAAIVSIAAFTAGTRFLKEMRPLWEYSEFLQTLEQDRQQRVISGKSAQVDPDTILRRDPTSRAFNEDLKRRFPERAFTIEQLSGERIMDFEPITFAPRLAGRPAMFIHCENDVIASKDNALELARASGGEARIIPELGHYDIYAGPGLDQVSAAAAELFAVMLQEPAPVGAPVMPTTGEESATNGPRAS
jgi:pimeloyl-ACP methyl ester carboxylesterase